MSKVTLESTEASFHQWREVRSSRKESIPDALWQMALSLYPKYNRSKICRRLGLSGGQFRQRIGWASPKIEGPDLHFGRKPVKQPQVRANSKGIGRKDDESQFSGKTGFVLAFNGGVKTSSPPKAEVQLGIQGKERSLTLSVGVDVLLELLPHVGALL